MLFILILLIYYSSLERIKNIVKLSTLSWIIILLGTSYAHSEYIAQIDIQQEGIVDSIYIKLLENDAPLTVQNFRNYVSDKDYENSFIHRSISNFIVQGGGFTFDSTLNDGSFSYDDINDEYPGGLQEVPKDASIINEFGNSNLRGTLAMAKIGARYEDDLGQPCFPAGINCTLVTGTGPDTATSEWFINLSNNSLNLDSQNGGFTVFAEVLGSGMDVIDEIANQTVYNRSDIHSAFSSLPLVNHISDPVIEEHLIFVKSVAEVLSITPDINYGSVTPGTSLQPEVVIINTGTDSIAIGAIGVNNSLSQPFRIVSDLCSNKELSPGQRCSIIVLFSPDSSGMFKDDFDVELPGHGINYQINLTGQGGPETAEPDITSSFSSIDFGTLDMLFSEGAPAYSRQAFIRNAGNLQLDFYKIAMSDISDSEFTLGGDCVDVNKLASGEFCTLSVLYAPLVAGSKTATIILESNDPDESSFEIPVFAIALPENDGVESDVENAAPNKGDGNNDDVPDSQQSYITSLPDINGTYITYVSYPNLPFIDVRVSDQSTHDENQDGVYLSAGVHEFTLDNVPDGEIVEVALLLPANVSISEYYIFSTTPDNPNLHWSEFDFDGETGALLLGVAKLTSPTGNAIERNVIKLRLKSDGRGDSGDAQDNKLVVKSAVNYINNDSGGILSLLFLPVVVTLFLFRRVSW